MARDICVDQADRLFMALCILEAAVEGAACRLEEYGSDSVASGLKSSYELLERDLHPLLNEQHE